MSRTRVSWRGRGRYAYLFLTLEQTDLAEAEYAKATSARSRLDSLIRAVLRQLDLRYGGRLEGIEHSLKAKNSYFRKLAAEIDARVPPEQAVARQRDLNRYTVTFPAGSYVAGVNDSYERLREHGFTLVSGRDTWEDPAYKGINTVWRHEETGRMVEIQFHTPESYAAKQDTHAAYELIRSGRFANGRPVTQEHRLAAQQMQAERYRQPGREVVVPEGHETVQPETITRPAPRQIPEPSTPQDAQARVRARDEVAAEVERMRQERAVLAEQAQQPGRVPRQQQGWFPRQRGRPGRGPWGPPAEQVQRLTPGHSSGGQRDDPGNSDRDRPDRGGPEPI